ncbi:MAG TPA: hypothetical protein VGQ33_01575 [Vicinamibacteria bacterium]|jgi:hypothetical protein|nr:hypothetical protein [Vicinamibacteria bacterium]
MKAPILLRISSIISLLFATGHSLGGRQSWSPAGETEVLRAMKTVSYHVMGVDRSYWDFYAGFGWTLSVYQLLQAVLLWQFATIAKDEPRRVRPLVASFFVATIASALIAWKLIFAVPVVFSGVLAVCLALAYVACGSPH